MPIAYDRYVNNLVIDCPEAFVTQRLLVWIKASAPVNNSGNERAGIVKGSLAGDLEWLLRLGK